MLNANGCYIRVWQVTARNISKDMQMTKIQLIPSPYKLANGKWVPRITRRVDTGEKIHEVKLEDWDEKFNTKEEVDAFVKAEIEVMKIDGLA